MNLITLSTTHRSPLSQLHESQQAITSYLGPGPLHRREETHKRPFRLTFQVAECSPAFKSPLFLSQLQFMLVYSIPSPSQASYNSSNGFLRSKSSTDISCIHSISAFLLLLHWCRQRIFCDAGYFPDLRPCRQFPPLLQHDNNFPSHKSWQFVLAQGTTVELKTVTSSSHPLPSCPRTSRSGTLWRAGSP
jgi:hypothetical protein